MPVLGQVGEIKKYGKRTNDHSQLIEIQRRKQLLKLLACVRCVFPTLA